MRRVCYLAFASRKSRFGSNNVACKSDGFYGSRVGILGSEISGGDFPPFLPLLLPSSGLSCIELYCILGVIL